jgi:deoxyribose-phosphate aldolase
MFAHPELEKDFANAAAIRSGSFTKSAVAQLVDSTVLKSDSVEERIESLCAEAVRYGFRSVCVPPSLVSRAAASLRQQGPRAVLVCTVVGFPNGYNEHSVKVFETSQAVAAGADEIDFVQNAGWVKSRQWERLRAEYEGIVAAASGKLVKIILETSLLTEEEIRLCSLLAARAGVHVVKTSTGFGSRGASVRDIEVIAAALAEVEKETGKRFGIKASGGVRSMDDARALIAAGATRLGTSGGAAIVDGSVHSSTY